jgi:hypothetical protein
MNSDGIVMGYVRSLEPGERERTSVWLAGDPPIIEWLTNAIEPKPTETRARRKLTLASALKAAAKHNASVEVDPATGRMTLKPGAAKAISGVDDDAPIDRSEWN